MHRSVLPLVVVMLAACSRGDSTADTTAAVSDSAPPAAAAAPTTALSSAQLQGTWNGTSYLTGTDSVVATWAMRFLTDTTAVLTYANGGPEVPYRTTYAGDSLVGMSSPYTLPRSAAGARKVAFHSVGRFAGDSLVGVSHIMLADKPDSIVRTARWVAKRAP